MQRKVIVFPFNPNNRLLITISITDKSLFHYKPPNPSKLRYSVTEAEIIWMLHPHNNSFGHQMFPSKPLLCAEYSSKMANYSAEITSSWKSEKVMFRHGSKVIRYPAPAQIYLICQHCEQNYSRGKHTIPPRNSLRRPSRLGQAGGARLWGPSMPSLVSSPTVSLVV